MGKTKIIKDEAASDARQESNIKADQEGKKDVPPRGGKRRISSGVLYVDATFNNTKVLFADQVGNALAWSSSGSLGFKGAKKGTPFAASKVGDVIGGKASAMGVKESGVVVRGVGSGREPAIRAFMAHGIEITFVKDATSVPHNGPKPKKPRRV